MSEPEKSSSCLTPGQKRVLLDVARCAIPAPPSGELSHEEAGTVEFVDGFLAGTTVDVKFTIKLVLFIFEWLLPLPCGMLGRFSTMKPEKQARYISHLEHSRLYLKRILLRMLAALCLMGYYSRPPVKRHMHFEETPL